MTFIENKALESRCRSLAEGIELPQPFSLSTLVDAVSRQHGQDIQLRSLPADVGPGVSGILKRITGGYEISYPVRADPWWALMCVCHELSHIMCGHASHPPRDPEHDGDQGPTRATVQIIAHLPDMQDACEAWGGRLFRCEMHTEVEQEAELTATLLVQRIERIEREAGNPLRPSSPDRIRARDDNLVLSRFSDLLGSHRDRRS